jgi:NAD(P)-dependent dehydrogenase (short-subunit alcohol dehydrogenase family)
MISKIIFITGCSSGIGYDAAIALKSRGHRVIASCRQLSDVEKLQQLGVDTIQLDVNDECSIATAVTCLLEKTDGQLDILINNAGYGQAGALEDVPRSTLIAQFNTNVFGLATKVWQNKFGTTWNKKSGLPFAHIDFFSVVDDQVITLETWSPIRTTKYGI